MTPEQFHKIISQLPARVRAVINSQELIDAALAIDNEHKLNAKQGQTMMVIYRSLIAKEYGPAELLQHVTSEMKLAADVAKEFTIAFLGTIILPLESYYGPVQQLIRELGGDPEPFVVKAKKTFPEVFAAAEAGERSTTRNPDDIATPAEGESHALLEHFEDRITTPHGRGEILIRLTGLAQEVEKAATAETITTGDAEELMHQLDILSYAVNTSDLNPLEIQSLKRRLRRVLHRLESA